MTQTFTAGDWTLIQFHQKYCPIAFYYLYRKNIDLIYVLCLDEYKSTVIRQCNITGKWDIFDAELTILCFNQTGNLKV